MWNTPSSFNGDDEYIIVLLRYDVRLFTLTKPFVVVHRLII